jgi:tetratricopeptide (TPR) repeat protein
VGAHVGQIELILTEVDQLEKEQKWPEALAAARRAEAVVAGGGADPATERRVRERLKDLEFIDRLEQIRMQRETWVGWSFDNAGADREYARAFRDYGMDVEELAVETSIDRLKARPAIAIALAAALDNWGIARANSGGDAARWKRLVAVARGIDPEPLRDRVRAIQAQPVAEVGDELRRLAESIDVRAQHPATLQLLATELHWANYPDAAVRLLRDAQRAHPGDFWLNYDLAHRLEELKDREGAVRFYTAAVTARPRATTALNDLGKALSRQKKLDEAIAVYHRALEIDPNFAYAHTNLGNALRDQNKLDDAVAAHRKAVELDPELAPAHNNLGSALADKGRVDEASACYKKAIELDPKHANTHTNLGNLLCDHRKEYDKAIECFRHRTRPEKCQRPHRPRCRPEATAEARRGHRLLPEGHRTRSETRPRSQQPRRRPDRPEQMGRGHPLSPQGHRTRPDLRPCPPQSWCRPEATAEARRGHRLLQKGDRTRPELRPSPLRSGHGARDEEKKD